MNNQNIKHSGEIIEINNTEIKVKIISTSACAACHAKGSCTASDSADKIIDISTFDASIYSIGEHVNVVMRKDLGIKALFLGYLLPFILLVCSLFIIMNITNNELMSGIISLSVVIPYYLILYLFRNRIQKSFTFHIEKAC